jgi:hypothetical protein
MKLKLLFINAFFMLFLTLAAAAQVDADVKLPDHPRILMLKGEEASIKTTIAGDKTWSKINDAILNESDNLISKPPVERIKIGRRLLDKSREALRRLFLLSYAYRMTQQPKYLERAEKGTFSDLCF